MNTHDIELRSAVMGAITDVWDRAKQIDDAADEVLDLIEAYCKRRGAPEYLISACYFPGHDEVELTWERKSDGAKAALTCTVTPEQGKQIADVVWPCVYHTATPQPAEPVKVPSDDLAHEIWAAAQAAPGGGIEGAVERVAALLARRIGGEA